MNGIWRICLAASALSVASAGADAADTHSRPLYQARAQHGWSGGGVTVAEVVPHTAAASAGIRVGDVIFSINGCAVGSYDDIDSQVAASGGHPIAIDLYRGGRYLRLHVAPRATRLPSPYGQVEHQPVLGLAHWDQRLILMPCALDPDCE
jgi:S1-C subfamily serine protease